MARAAQEVGDIAAEHARRQFEDSRKVLANVKAELRTFARTTFMQQVNAGVTTGRVENVVTRFAGQWEWCVELQRADERSAVFLEFGPTAVVENARVPQPLADPDYSCVFVTIDAEDGESITKIVQTEVSLGEVLSGLTADDERLLRVVHGVAAGEQAAPGIPAPDMSGVTPRTLADGADVQSRRVPADVRGVRVAEVPDFLRNSPDSL